MKRVIALLMCIVLAVCALGINTLADTGISPRLNNVADVGMQFSIDSNGTAKVVAFFDGDSTTTSATIKIKIQKQFLFFFWTDVIEWTDETTEKSYAKSFSTQVDSGTYKATIEYTIRGTGGEPDVITDTIERTY